MSSKLYSDTVVAPISVDTPSREVIATISTSALDRAGDIVEPQGINYAAFMKTGSVLFNHDQDQPIARCTNISVMGDRVVATAKFPEVGKSGRADEIYNLIQSHVINSTSIGFMPTATTPIKEGSGRVTGLRITKCDLLEFSFVSVPANPQALIAQRSFLKSPSKADEPPMSEEKRRRLLELSRIGQEHIDIERVVRGLPVDRAQRIREVYAMSFETHITPLIESAKAALRR
jgi:HK97 family phage prohead protease